MSGILAGKRILITGVLMESSIAFHTARLAQEQGAEIILTAFPRPTLTERIARKLPKPTKVIELDVTNDEHLGRLADIVGEELGGLDGVVHSIGFAELASVWDSRAPLEWDLKDPEPAGRGVVALLSDWFPKTTGEIIHVDGGLH